MKLLETKWTKHNCIMCFLIILSIFLIMYLFRHNTLIEGFSFGGIDTSNISSSMPSTPSMPSMPSMPSTPSMPTSLSSGWSNIGPIPTGNTISSDTYSAFQTKFKDVVTAQIDSAKSQGKPAPMFSNTTAPSLSDLQNYATEDDLKYFISNGEWQYPSQMTQCITDFLTTTLTAQATKAGKPAPDPSQIQDFLNYINTSIVPRQLSLMGTIGFFFGACLNSCIASLKETVFIRQMVKFGFNTDSSVKSIYDLDNQNYYRISENKYLTCDLSAKAPVLKSWNDTSKTVTTSPSSYDQLPTLVKGFNFITPVDKFALCNMDGIQQSAFILDNQGVSPFYQGFWGVPANSTPSTTNSQPASTSTSTSPSS